MEPYLIISSFNLYNKEGDFEIMKMETEAQARVFTAKNATLWSAVIF